MAHAPHAEHMHADARPLVTRSGSAVCNIAGFCSNTKARCTRRWRQRRTSDAGGQPWPMPMRFPPSAVSKDTRSRHARHACNLHRSFRASDRFFCLNSGPLKTWEIFRGASPLFHRHTASTGPLAAQKSCIQHHNPTRTITYKKNKNKLPKKRWE